MVLGGSANRAITVGMGKITIENTNEENVLGVTIDLKLTFETHLESLSHEWTDIKINSFSQSILTLKQTIIDMSIIA